MEFKKLLSYYRERSGLSKTGLAERMNITPTYAMELESGRKPAPNISRCREIAKILNLTPSEAQALIDAAVEERLAPDELLWLAEREKKYKKLEGLSQETIEALSDPDSVRALLSTFKSKEDVKPIIRDVIENLNHLSKEQRKEVLKYCQ